jgi:hypothetical protein
VLVVQRTEPLLPVQVNVSAASLVDTDDTNAKAMSKVSRFIA